MDKNNVAELNLTSREVEMVLLAWKCMGSTRLVNWSELARLALLKDERSAKDALRGANRKIKEMRGSAVNFTPDYSSTTPPPAATGPKGATKKKKGGVAKGPVKAESTWKDGFEGQEDPTVLGPQLDGGGTKRKAPAEKEDDDSDECICLGDSPLKKMKTEEAAMEPEPVVQPDAKASNAVEEPAGVNPKLE